MSLMDIDNDEGVRPQLGKPESNGTTSETPLVEFAFPANNANPAASVKPGRRLFGDSASALAINNPVPTATKRQQAFRSVFGQPSTTQVGPGAHFAAAARAIQKHIERETREQSAKPVGDYPEVFGEIHGILMDDYARPQYERRGGGGGGRKRRFREDDQEDRRGGSYAYPQKRNRYEREESWSSRVRKQIFTIADSPLRDPREDVVAISKNIVDNFEDEYFRNHIADNLLQLVVEQPFKIPFAAPIVLYTNERNPAFAKLVLEKTTARLQAAVDEGEWRTFKLLLRFLGIMQSLFEGQGVLPLLEELFDRAADLQTASSDDVLGIELVKTIMLTIPYVLTTPTASAKEQAAELLGKTDIIASADREIDAANNPYMNFEGQDAPISQSLVRLLQKQLQTEAENEWKLEFIPKLFDPEAAKQTEDQDAKAEPEVKDEPAQETDGNTNGSAISKHAFPEITLPQTMNPGLRTTFPEVYFSLFADQEVESVPPTTSLAASLLRDTLVDTINALDFNRMVSAKYLLEIDCYFTPGTFIKRATPFDKVLEVAGDGGSTWKPEDLVVDAIFSQMLQLPTPEHKLIYYHSMITETCKIAAGSIAPCLGRAIRYLYKNLDSMDLELVYRFNDWFAHHLSNFDFRWKWVEWLPDVDLPDLQPRKAFILGVLDKEIRLSFAKRVRDTLPDPYHVLVPTSRDNDIPEFKYNDETIPYSAEGKGFLDCLRRRTPETEDNIISAILSFETENGSQDPFIPVVDAYVTALCYIGSKSLSHVLSYIERSKDRLASFGPASPFARVQIIDSVVDYWRDVQPGVAVNIVDKLLNYQILTPASVVEWALGAGNLDGGRILSVTWVYEMVQQTIVKVTTRVRQIVAARQSTHLTQEQVETLDKTLEEEAASMRELFTYIDDALAGVAGGAEESMLEQDVEAEELAGLKAWGGKWRRAFARKLAVEEMVIREAKRVFPGPGGEEGMGALEDGVGNGNGNGVGNGGDDAAAVDDAEDIL